MPLPGPSDSPSLDKRQAGHSCPLPSASSGFGVTSLPPSPEVRAPSRRASDGGVHTVSTNLQRTQGSLREPRRQTRRHSPRGRREPFREPCGCCDPGGAVTGAATSVPGRGAGQGRGPGAGCLGGPRGGRVGAPNWMKNVSAELTLRNHSALQWGSELMSSMAAARP